MATPDDVKARVALAYNSAADFYDHPSNTFWHRYGQRTVERLGIASGARVLDVCCGAGASALPAAEAAGPDGRVLAVDLSEELIRLGRDKASQQGLRNIEFRVADMMTLEGAAPGFDYIVCVFGLFFVPDMTGALRHLGSLLAPGGRIAITTWSKDLFEPINSIFWAAVRDVRPELFKAFNPWDRIGDPSAVQQLFADAGLPGPEVAFEEGRHTVRGEDDVMALLMGTGYRGVLQQLSVTDRTTVVHSVLAQAEDVAHVKTDVIYATK